MSQNQNIMDHRFANESIPKLIFSLATPSIVAQLINALYNVVDRMYIGRIPGIGALALTGVGVTFPLIMLISAFAALVGYGGAPQASICMGEGNRKKAEKIMGNCFAMMIGFSVLLTGLLMVFKDPILLLFGASTDTLPYASEYMTIYLLGTLSVQITLGMNQFISAQGYAKTAMMTVGLGATLNILLDTIFIFVLDMGVRGAALATIISQTASAIWVLLFLLSGHGTLRLRLKNMHIDPRLAVSALALGLSPFIMQSTESLVQIVFNKSLSFYGGDLYVGVMVIFSSIMQFFNLPLLGMAQGTQPIIGYNFGAGNFKRVKDAIRYCTIFCFAISLFLWCIALFAPEILAILFTDDATLMTLAPQYMPLFFFGMILFGFQISFQQSFIALGEAKISIFIASLRKLILLIPLVLILPRIIQPSELGIFLAEPIADMTAALTCCVLFALRMGKLFSNRASEKQS